MPTDDPLRKYKSVMQKFPHPSSFSVRFRKAASAPKQKCRAVVNYGIPNVAHSLRVLPRKAGEHSLLPASAFVLYYVPLSLG